MESKDKLERLLSEREGRRVFFVKRFPSGILQGTLTVAGILVFQQGNREFRRRIEVLGEGFGEALLSRRPSPILTALNANPYQD
jgi:hypothetical protein